MVVPDWDVDGLLPVGRHPATLEQIYDRFVVGATHARERRELLFGCLKTWIQVLQQFVPHGRLWVDGGFVTDKAAPPHDIDVVVFPERPPDLSPDEVRDLDSLFTLQDILVGSPGPFYLDRLQPVGGTLDAFVCGRLEDEPYWDGIWSSLKLPDGRVIDGPTKGYVEVVW